MHYDVIEHREVRTTKRLSGTAEMPAEGAMEEATVQVLHSSDWYEKGAIYSNRATFCECCGEFWDVYGTVEEVLEAPGDEGRGKYKMVADALRGV